MGVVTAEAMAVAGADVVQVVVGRGVGVEAAVGAGAEPSLRTP